MPAIKASTSAFSSASATKEELAMLSLLHYGIYTITNRRRQNGSGDLGDAFEAVAQCVKEGAKGHSFAQRTLDGRWNARNISHAIPDVPLLQLAPVILRFRALRPTQASH